jgi:hypothetical protein
LIDDLDESSDLPDYSDYSELSDSEQHVPGDTAVAMPVSEIPDSNYDLPPDFLGQSDDFEADPNYAEPPIPRKRIRSKNIQSIFNGYADLGHAGADIVGTALGYKRTSIFKAVQLSGALPETQGPSKRKKKWDPSQIAALIAHIEEDTTQTLQQLLLWGETQGFPKITLSTLDNYLTDAVITLKRTTDQNQQRNSPENIAARAL